ncbi:FadR/GntR family transcriptional regulator [Nesterenkonia haasae]|uniref:FadR/GntR family transcriptional regulator n=1 Tax=Nesterenkonia haasae TaxID=2587813 RepID=UPI001391D269|nr:FCD domain-containing protein [Nesterenkonia haasae]
MIDYLDGENLKPGAHLPGEIDLAKEMQVSRSQIREALRMLEALGVVKTRQGARRIWLGFTTSAFAHQLVAVLKPTARSLTDLLDIRQALETSMLPRAMTVMNANDKDLLEQVAVQMVELAQAGESFTDYDEEFHRLIFASLGNELLNGLHAAFWSVYGAYAKTDPPEERPVPVAMMHLRIAQAVQAGDTKRAVHELDAHYYGIRTRTSSRLSPTSSESADGSSESTFTPQ